MPKNVKQNTQRDNLGRTLSNVITSIPLADFQLTNIDVLDQDLENGFGPLHQCLNSGYIHKAFLLNEAVKKKKKTSVVSVKKKSTVTFNDKKGASNDDANVTDLKNPWKIRDNDGDTPLELYYNKNFHMNKTLKSLHKNELISKLYVFGKIINMELGLGSNNDSVKEINLQNLNVQKIQMNKTRALLIDDSKRMYILKLKHLGEIIEKQNGTHLKKNEDYELKKYLEEPYPAQQFCHVFMSDTHTLAITLNQQLISFGDDEYGQCSTTPSSMSGAKGIIMNVGCSNISSCILTSKNELICWGLNTGQFGISELNSKNNSATLKTTSQGNQSFKVKEVNYKNHKSFMGNKPFVYQLPTEMIGEVRQLIHLDYATIVLHGDNGLLVLTQFRELHFFIPNLGKKEVSFKNFISERMTGVNKVEKLYVKGEYGSQVVCKFENGVLGLLDLNDTLNAMSDDDYYMFHDKLKNKDVENMWTRQRFQLPMKILFKPNNELQKKYVLDVGNNDKSLKCGMINFYGDYFYLNTKGTTQGFEQKKYYNCLKDVDIFASDGDCNNFMILKREYDLVDKETDGDYGKVSESLKPKNIEMEDYENNNYTEYYKPLMKRKFDAHYIPDIHVLAYDKNPFLNLHSQVLSFICPNNLLFNHDAFEVIDKTTLVYKSNNIDDMNALKDALLSLYTGKITNSSNRTFKIMTDIFKVDKHENLETLVKSKYGKGDAIIKAESMEYNCDPEIMRMSSKFFEFFFINSEANGVIDFSNFSNVAIETLLESMHLLEFSAINSDESLSVGNALELLCLSDYLQMSELKKKVESVLLAYHMKSDNVSVIMMAAYLYKLDALFKKCCNYLFLNIELLFSDEHVISEIKSNFNFKIWSELESNLNNLVNLGSPFDEKAWYNKPDHKALFKKFSSDMKQWNLAFNTSFTLESEYTNTPKIRTKSTVMSRSSSVSSTKKGANDKPILKNPFNKSNETLSGKYVSVFNDDDDYSDMGSIISNSSKHRKSSVTSKSFELAGDMNRRKNTEDDFVMTGTVKSKGNKKAKAKTPEIVQPVKIVPGSKPLKKVNAVNTEKKLAGSSTKIPVSVIKQGPSLNDILPKQVVKKEEPVIVNEVEKSKMKELPKLPSLNNKNSTILQKDPKAKVSRRNIKVAEVKTPTNNNINVPLKKQKDGTLYTNLTLDEMISLAAKDNKNQGSHNVWFQGESNLLNKKLNSGISKATVSSSEASKSKVVSGVSKWDYTKQSYVNNTGHQKLVSLNELYKSKK